MLLWCFYSWMSNFWKFHHRLSWMDCLSVWNTLRQVTLGRKESTFCLSQQIDQSQHPVLRHPEVFPSLDYMKYIATFSYGYVVLAAQQHYRRYTKITSYGWFETNGMKKGDKTSLKYVYNFKCPTLHIWDAYSKSFLWSSLSLCFCR